MNIDDQLAMINASVDWISGQIARTPEPRQAEELRRRLAWERSQLDRLIPEKKEEAS
jgi:hypothetical protein